VNANAYLHPGKARAKVGATIPNLQSLTAKHAVPSRAAKKTNHRKVIFAVLVSIKLKLTADTKTSTVNALSLKPEEPRRQKVRQAIKGPKHYCQQCIGHDSQEDSTTGFDCSSKARTYHIFMSINEYHEVIGKKVNETMLMLITLKQC